MKKRIIVSLILVLCVLSGCGNKSNNPFTEEFISGITHFQYNHFNGEVSIYNDEETLELVKEVLRAGEYVGETIAPEGSYSFEVISNDEMHEFVWSGNTLGFGDKVYKVEKHRFEELLVYTKK